MREQALYARRHRRTSGFSDLLADLGRLGRYERRTALHLAMAARDLEYVETILTEPDMALRRAALRAVRTLPVSDEAAAAVLDDAPLDLRLALYRTLAHARRSALADRLLTEVRDRWGDREGAALLPACTAAVVSRHLPDLTHAVTSWRALGRRHPNAVLDTVERELSEAPGWWRRHEDAVIAAASAEPGRVLAILERHDIGWHAAHLPAAVAGALFEVDPDRTARVLLGARGWGLPWNTPSRTLLTLLRRCSDEQIVAVAKDIHHHLGPILRALPPARRTAIFQSVRVGDRALPVWWNSLLAILPAERAAAEARRSLEWHASVWHSARSRLDDPDIPLRLTSHLPYEEAAGSLREAAFGGDPRRRGLARTLLVECAARSGDRTLLAELLDELTRRTENEQDPLRGTLLTAVRELRPGLLDDRCAGALERLAARVAEAGDSSPATCAALRGLAARVLRHHDPGVSPDLIAWAFGVYDRLVRRYGADALTWDEEACSTVRRRRRRGAEPTRDDRRERLDTILRAGQERELLTVLRPHLRASRERADFALVVALRRALGRRARPLDELQDDLRLAALRAPEPLARQAAEFWLADAPDRDERAASLVRDDPSTIELPAVWRTIAGRRTDLLGIPVSDGSASRRPDSGPWVPDAGGGLPGRWTPHQCDQVRGRLRRVIQDDRLPVADRMAAVRAAGRLPAALGELTTLAERADPVIAETAIEALAGTDTPAEALPILLTYARGPASRTAVAAAARCCRAVRSSRLRPILERALLGPDTKVTVRKEAARQLAGCRVPGAVDLLLRAWESPDTHRDVRVAVAVALRRVPEDPRTLPALRAAADPYAGELMARTLFQANPHEYGTVHRPAYADLVRRLLLAADGPGVRFRASKAFATWAPWYQGGFVEIIRAAGDPEDPAGDGEVSVLLSLLRAGTLHDEILDVLGRLAAVHRLFGTDTTGSADHRDDTASRAPARIRSIVDILATDRSAGRRFTPWEPRLVREAMRLLAAEPRHLPEAARLGVALLPVPERADGAGPESASSGAGGGPVAEAAEGDTKAARLADHLGELADLLANRPVLATRAAKLVASQFRDYRSHSNADPALLLATLRRLSGRIDLAAGLFAVALTRIGGDRAGWPGEWREVLWHWRGSSQPEVAQDAWNVMMLDH
ncbi:HEAT repeat domain-containing protein [Actinoallomurus purpureus]|uniref:HEAT repeat domain-containing protein n=1 Tax=Actinoallomurus purpureus TaxID=478114 RepID=UPI0020923187|nr:HEAT repeat domain-containing protein [Actinoallomurus purpureus]MCO6005131.1 HEAT repeat domain-containing protein [Actinoallomurus purpureus]